MCIIQPVHVIFCQNHCDWKINIKKVEITESKIPLHTCRPLPVSLQNSPSARRCHLAWAPAPLRLWRCHLAWAPVPLRLWRYPLASALTIGFLASAGHAGLRAVRGLGRTSPAPALSIRLSVGFLLKLSVCHLAHQRFWQILPKFYFIRHSVLRYAFTAVM